MHSKVFVFYIIIESHSAKKLETLDADFDSVIWKLEMNKVKFVYNISVTQTQKSQSKGTKRLKKKKKGQILRLSLNPLLVHHFLQQALTTWKRTMVDLWLKLPLYVI